VSSDEGSTCYVKEMSSAEEMLAFVIASNPFYTLFDSSPTMVA
jgi:hypothetical protein